MTPYQESGTLSSGDTLTTHCWMQNGTVIIQVEKAWGVALSNALCEFA